jgi:cysteine desulfurase
VAHVDAAMDHPIYLDYNASVPPAPEVVEAMMSWLGDRHANPHAEHLHGRRAAAAVEQAKASIGALIGADGDDIILTSGATESNNLVIQGYLGGSDREGALVHSAFEHKCVLETGYALEQLGTPVARIPVDRLGRVSRMDVRAAVDQFGLDRMLVSLIHANNEIGTVLPLRDMSNALGGSGAAFHTDASQSAGRVPLHVGDDGLDFVTLSSHKIGGPAGIAALYVAPDLRSELRPILFGGGQQEGLRPGTIPVFLSVGYGVACELAAKKMADAAAHSEAVAASFLEALTQHTVRFDVLGNPQSRLPGLRSIHLPGFDARELLDRIGGDVSASTGSACAAGELRASHVLRAIGLSEEEATSVLRFGFSQATSHDDARRAADVLAKACAAAVRSGNQNHRSNAA